MKILTLILITSMTFFTACEGFIRIEGNVYDKITNEPIDNVQAILILRNKDTIKSNQLEYDTVLFEERKALRKQGIPDDYYFHDPIGLSKFRPCLTDTTGKFQVGNMLVGCVPRCPTTKVLLIKDGYKPVTIEVGSIVKDSIQVFMEKNE